VKSWTPKAELYDFGRPFPAEKVVGLFRAFAGEENTAKLRALEPGCGTGRILVPLARAFPQWKFVGVDSSRESLQVCQARASKAGLQNIHLLNESIEESLPVEPVDIIIHSSVLHVIPNWRNAMQELCSRLTDDGTFCLIGDYGDIYDAALGRPSSTAIDVNLSRFWKAYIEIRKAAAAPDTESSQIGCRWDLDSSDLATWLEDHSFYERNRSQLAWTKQFSLADLFRIVEERCYSSMFTVDKEIFDRIIAQLKTRLPSLDIDTSAVSKHQAVARFYRHG
jgi:SAM-dependent methyltransferase